MPPADKIERNWQMVNSSPPILPQNETFGNGEKYMLIYFMGICGTAMGNAALLARAAGHVVEGADSGVYPPMSTVLAGAGITLHEGYDPARLQKLAPDLVV